MLNLSRYPVHHIGIAMTQFDFNAFTTGKSINTDSTQGVQTYFEFNNFYGCYVEYFTISGRAANYKPGFNHVCYQLANLIQFNQIAELLSQKDIGIQLTKVEKSGSKECNKVVFFFIVGIGIVEFNIND